MQDAETMKEAAAKHQIGSHKSRGFYNSINMLKVLERSPRENLKNKKVTALDIEAEKWLEVMKRSLQNAGIQDINSKDHDSLKWNEVQNQMCSNIQRKFVNEARSAWLLPIEGKSDKQSDDKSGVSAMVTDEFVSTLSEAYKDDLDVDLNPSISFKNIVAARLVLLDEVKKRESADEEILEEEWKPCAAQGRSDFFDVKMGSSSSSKVPIEGSTKIILKITQSSKPKKDQDSSPTPPRPQVDFKKLKPEWLGKFFSRTFFEPCSAHPIRRNELNKYCIECNAPLCQYCVSLASHANHRLLKIYRHVYKDVVPLDEIERHIDCSQIQPYRCNRQMVIALSPLPHQGTRTNEESTCLTCKRKLIEYNIYSYCSISCKAEAFVKKKDEHVPPFLVLKNQVQQTGNQEAPTSKAQTSKAPTSKTSKNSRKRKGVPCRSPLS